VRPPGRWGVMVVPLTFKHLFGLAAVGWALLWFFSAVAIGGVMGNSLPVLLIYLGMALVPPILLYILLFRVLPRVISYIKKPHQRRSKDTTSKCARHL